MLNANKETIFRALKQYTPENIWDDMMFMGNVGDIYLYKNYNTRRYINIDSNGNFYVYTGNDNKPYEEINKDAAIEYVMS